MSASRRFTRRATLIALEQRVIPRLALAAQAIGPLTLEVQHLLQMRPPSLEVVGRPRLGPALLAPPPPLHLLEHDVAGPLQSPVSITHGIYLNREYTKFSLDSNSR